MPALITTFIKTTSISCREGFKTTSLVKKKLASFLPAYMMMGWYYDRRSYDDVINNKKQHESKSRTKTAITRTFLLQILIIGSYNCYDSIKFYHPMVLGSILCCPYHINLATCSLLHKQRHNERHNAPRHNTYIGICI